MDPVSPTAPAQPHRVLCVGDMTVDIFAQAVAALPHPGEVVMTDRIAVFPGGNALNTAVALLRLGERVSFFGCVGDDPFGDLLLGELNKLSLDLSGVSRPADCATPTTLIYRVQNEDRRFLSALGAGDRFTGQNIPAALIPEGGVVLAAGYLKLRSWNDEALTELFRLAHQRHNTVVFNVCIPRDGEPGARRCLQLLPLVDVFVPNEDEAFALTGEREPSVQARVLRDAGAGAVVITRGSRGLLADNGKQVVDMGAFTVPLVDPTGCGDCFSAGLIAGILRSWEWVPLLAFASALGALAATALGSTSGVPAFATVEHFVRTHQIQVRIQ
jgi:sugar/nucleoside kinase (ribokinase family)